MSRFINDQFNQKYGSGKVKINKIIYENPNGK